MLFVYVFWGGVYGHICYSLGEKYFYMELKKRVAGLVLLVATSLLGLLNSFSCNILRID